MPAKSTGDTPAKVVFDLDAFEVEGRPEPFVFKAHGKTVELRDPQKTDWRDLARVGQLIESDPDTFFRTMMTEKDYNHFVSKPVPIAKTQALAAAWRKHYDLPDQGN